MKPTTFASYLSKYFTVYLANEQACAPTTIDSYRFAFILFLAFMEQELGITPDRVEITHLTRGNVLAFLDWLQDERHNSSSTRNQRQAAINSFVRYLIYELPEYLNEFQRILGVPLKRVRQQEISYLKADGVKLLLAQVNPDSRNGLRDHLILSLLYTTGIRVSELINIRVRDLSLFKPYTLLVHGKGHKDRYVPLMKVIIPQIQDYLAQQRLTSSEKLDEWIFRSHMHEQFTRQGISYIVRKYADQARKVEPELIPEDFSPHKMRHSTAMSLVDSGVDLIYIRDLLGHISVKTTEVYGRADAKRKREAIEAASLEIVPPEAPEWESDKNLRRWLMTFNKK